MKGWDTPHSIVSSVKSICRLFVWGRWPPPAEEMSSCSLVWPSSRVQSYQSVTQSHEALLPNNKNNNKLSLINAHLNTHWWTHFLHHFNKVNSFPRVPLGNQ